MKTYDAEARPSGAGLVWRALKARLKRWIDRERELIVLRNVVGMMSEARRADAAEYHEMASALRVARERIRTLERLL